MVARLRGNRKRPTCSLFRSPRLATTSVVHYAVRDTICSPLPKSAMPNDSLLLFLLRQPGLFTEAQIETFSSGGRAEEETIAMLVARLGLASEKEVLRVTEDQAE